MLGLRLSVQGLKFSGSRVSSVGLRICGLRFLIRSRD